MKPIYVVGAGLFSPGWPDVSAWFEKPADPAVERPRCAIVNARLKRGSSRFANMLGEVVEEATRQAGADLSTVATVYGSSLGEVTTMVTLLRMLYEEEGKLSPNRFKNSVHNAASGLISIGTENQQFSTAIAGGRHSFELSLLEAWGLLAADGGTVVLAVGDDSPPEPLDQLDDHGAMAIAFCLTATPPSDRPALRLERFRRAEGRGPERVPEGIAGNCGAAGLALLEAFFAMRGGTIAVGPVASSTAAVDVTPLASPAAAG